MQTPSHQVQSNIPQLQSQTSLNEDEENNF